MTYPEHGASYKRNPKWLDDAKRAEGGGVPVLPINPMDNLFRGSLNQARARKADEDTIVPLESAADRFENPQSYPRPRLKRAEGGSVAKRDSGGDVEAAPWPVPPEEPTSIVDEDRAESTAEAFKRGMYDKGTYNSQNNPQNQQALTPRTPREFEDQIMRPRLPNETQSRRSLRDLKD